jgi:hypothetical protein
MLFVCITIAFILIVAICVIGWLAYNHMKKQTEPSIYELQVDKKSTYYFSKTINTGKPKLIWQG